MKAVTFAVPASETALGDTFERLPDVGFRLDRVAESGSRSRFAPVWIDAADRSELDAALAEDPSVTVAGVLIEGADALLYELEFGERMRAMADVVFDHGGVIRDAVARDGTWRFRLLFPEEAETSIVHETLRDRGLRVEVTHVSTAEWLDDGGLTDKQYEALRIAHRSGYYEIPRETSLENLAEQVTITYQSLSERLRRAHRELVERALVADGVSASSAESRVDRERTGGDGNSRGEILPTD